MRSAEELALAIDQGCDLDAAVPLIEADHRAAQIEVLREIQRSVQNRNEGAAWSIRIRDKIAELEKGEGGA